MNKHIGTIISPYEKEKNMIIKAILSKKILEDYETVLIDKSGNELNVRVSVYPVKVKSKKSEFFLVIVEDITEEKTYREKFQTLQKTYAELMDEIQIGVLIVDRETFEILFTNKKGMELLQLSSDENLGRKIWDLVDPENVKDVNAIFSDKMSMDGSPYLIKMRRYHDKVKIWVNIYISEVIYHKRPSYLISFVEITREIERIKTLEETVKQKEILAATKSRFMANMSHELRSPINIILGYVDILVSMDIKEEFKEFLVYIQKSAEHLLKTLNDILDLSKAEASKIKL